MCEGCRKIEEKIAHYREMASYVMDRPTLDSIDVLVARLSMSPFLKFFLMAQSAWLGVENARLVPASASLFMDISRAFGGIWT